MPHHEAMVIDALTLQQYHDICYVYLGRYRTIGIPTDETVNIGPILACSPGDQLEALAEIAFLPDAEVRVERWWGPQGKVMENGWKRYFILFV